MDIETKRIIEQVPARAPDWVRHDLLSRDGGVRKRGEDALAAMIADALESASVDQ